MQRDAGNTDPGGNRTGDGAGGIGRAHTDGVAE